MGYNSNTYYSSLHHSITSICKSILPFSFNNPRLDSADHKLAKQQSDNLKWQQNCFHQILNLMGLEKQGIVSPSHVSAFRSQLLQTLLASKGVPHHEPSPLLRDKLLFLQELLYTNCISEDEYHASKRPLLQRLAAQGAEINATDVIVCTQKGGETSEDVWSDIDLRDDQTLHIKDNCRRRNQSKLGSSAIKHIKDAAFVLRRKNKQHRTIFDLPSINYPCSLVNSDTNYNNSSGATICKDGSCGLSENILTTGSEIETGSVLMSEEGIAPHSETFRGKEGRAEGHKLEKIEPKSARKLWEVGLDGLKRWKRSNNKDNETTPLPLKELVDSPVGQGPNTKEMKRKLLSGGSDHGFFIDKVLGDNIKKELSRIQTHLSATNPNFKFSNDEMDAISTKLPVDKADLKQFFPKSWCDRYGDVVLNVVKKEFQNHVGEMADTRNAVLERRHTNSKRWTSFEDSENHNPNQTFGMKQNPFISSVDAAE